MTTAAFIVPGHGLTMDGRVWDGERFGGGPGHGKCRCGMITTEELPNIQARREWHRAHKERVLDERGALVAIASASMPVDRDLRSGRIPPPFTGTAGGSIESLRSTLDTAATREVLPPPPLAELVIPMLQDLLRQCDEDKAELEMIRTTLLGELDGFSRILDGFSIALASKTTTVQ